MTQPEPPTITITLIEHGTETVEVDRAAYEAAKVADELDRPLDIDASDMDTETTVVEPDGTLVSLYGGPVYRDLRPSLRQLAASYSASAAEARDAGLKADAELLDTVVYRLRQLLGVDAEVSR